jgi:hypothetical protein
LINDWKPRIQKACLGSFFDDLALLDLAGTQATGADQDPLGTAVHDCADGLEVGHLAAQMHAGDVQPDSALFFRFTAAGNLAGLDRAFGTNVTDLSHGNTPRFLRLGAALYANAFEINKLFSFGKGLHTSLFRHLPVKWISGQAGWQSPPSSHPSPLKGEGVGFTLAPWLGF